MSNPEIFYFAIYKEGQIEVEFASWETKIGFVIKQELLSRVKTQNA